MAFDDDPGLYHKLIHRGITRHEIERLYKKLREKGYGEKAPDRRFQNIVRRLKTDGNAENPSNNPSSGTGSAPSVVVDIRKPELIENGAYWAGTDELHVREEDLLPKLRNSLRRKINRWAYRRGFAIVGTRERFRDFLTFLFPNLPDYVNDGFVSKLLIRNGYRNVRPDDLSLLDSLDALHELARFFLGKERRNRSHLIRSKLTEIERNINDSIRRRDRFAWEFLRTFSNLDEKLARSVEFIDSSFSGGKRIENSHLVRIVRQVNRFFHLTCRIDSAHVRRMLETVKDVNLAYDRSRSIGEELAAAELIFCKAFELLSSYRHELYPSLLKMMNVFFPEEDAGDDKLTAIYEFLRIKEADVLDFGRFTAEEKKRLEDAAAALKETEADQGEPVLPEEPFARKFEPVLEMLEALFPESGIRGLEEYPPLIPYFDCLVFRNSLIFYHEGQDIELLGRKDPVGQIMVLHRLLDNLLNSVNEFNLEKVLDIPSLGDRLIRIKYDWKDVYTYLFEPYVETITQYGKELTSGRNPTRERSVRVRNFEEELNALRNFAIRDYGYTLARPEFSRTPRLYLLAEQLCDVLTLVGTQINGETVRNESVFARRIYAELDERKVVDFRFTTDQGALDYKPATHQVVRYLETKYSCSIDGIPRLAQIQFLDFFRSLAEMYRYLLNGGKSFYRNAGSGIFLSDPDDVKSWAGFRGKTDVGRLDLRKKRNDGVPLTSAGEGLHSSFEEIPVRRRMDDAFRSFRERKAPFCLIALSIDRFEWIPDPDGRTRNAVFDGSFAVVSRHLKGGRDFVIFLDGGEMLVFFGCRSETAIDTCRQILSAQSAALGTFPEGVRLAIESARVPGTGAAGTFSIGLYSVLDEDTPDSAFDEVRKLAEEARKFGDCTKVANVRADDVPAEIR